MTIRNDRSDHFSRVTETVLHPTFPDIAKSTSASAARDASHAAVAVAAAHSIFPMYIYSSLSAFSILSYLECYAHTRVTRRPLGCGWGPHFSMRAGRDETPARGIVSRAEKRRGSVTAANVTTDNGRRDGTRRQEGGPYQMLGRPDDTMPRTRTPSIRARRQPASDCEAARRTRSLLPPSRNLRSWTPALISPRISRLSLRLRPPLFPLPPDWMIQRHGW